MMKISTVEKEEKTEIFHTQLRTSDSVIWTEC